MRKILFIILCLLAGSVKADTFGYESVAAYFLTIMDNVLGVTATPSSSGTLDSVKVYLQVPSGSAAHNVHCAIYKTSDTSLIDSSEIKSIAVGISWIVFDLKLDGQIFADTEYAIVAQSETAGGDCGMYMSLTGNPWAYENGNTYGVWADPWTGMTNSYNRDVSIYAYYTPTPAAGGPINALHSADGSGVRHSKEGASALH